LQWIVSCVHIQTANPQQDLNFGWTFIHPEYTVKAMAQTQFHTTWTLDELHPQYTVQAMGQTQFHTIWRIDELHPKDTVRDSLLLVG
jgi:hypothetical protein